MGFFIAFVLFLVLIFKNYLKFEKVGLDEKRLSNIKLCLGLSNEPIGYFSTVLTK
jgi:hypothetical protein